jgi:hypothetical protein
VEILGPATEGLLCRVGAEVLPFEACADRLLLARGTLARMLETGEPGDDDTTRP